MSNLEKAKETLLHFASSELASHASNLMGLSVILFAYLTAVFQSCYFPRIEINLSYIPPRPTFDYVVIYIIFWFLNSGIVFSTMRLVYYGKYGHAIIVFPETKDDEKWVPFIDGIKTLRDRVAENATKGKFKTILRWFSTGISEFGAGVLVSLILGFIISLALFWVFFIK